MNNKLYKRVPTCISELNFQTDKINQSEHPAKSLYGIHMYFKEWKHFLK